MQDCNASEDVDIMYIRAEDRHARQAEYRLARLAYSNRAEKATRIDGVYFPGEHSDTCIIGGICLTATEAQIELARQQGNGADPLNVGHRVSMGMLHISTPKCPDWYQPVRHAHSTNCTSDGSMIGVMPAYLSTVDRRTVIGFK